MSRMMNTTCICDEVGTQIKEVIIQSLLEICIVDAQKLKYKREFYLDSELMRNIRLLHSELFKYVKKRGT